ncbi:MAG: tripartite tricarboxylate transporter substrate binding protein [Burkholderiales bacterium]
MTSATALAQAPADYPKARAITIVSPTAAGSAADTIARLVAQKLGEGFASAIVENRPGAGGNIAAQHVKRAAPDGYTLFVHSNSLVINPSLYANAGYDAEKDFVAVIQGPRTPNLIGVHPSVAASNLAELIALARRERLSYASSGIGTTAHLSMERIKLLAGVDMTHVPYQPAQATGAAVAGHVQVVQTSMPPTIPQVKAGRLRAIAITGAQRSAALPDVPTVAESGYAGFDDVTWFGIFAPAGTPAEVVNRLNTELNRIFELEDLRARLGALGFSIARNTPAEFAQVIRSEIPKWAKAAKESGAKAE